jgi:hypothetical protein
MAKSSNVRKGPGTNLTKTGWVGDNGTQGSWTDFADIVVNTTNGVCLIGDKKYRYSAKGIVSSEGGNDQIKGTSASGPGVYLDTAFLLTGKGDDVIEGGFSSPAPYSSDLPDIPVILLINTYLSTDAGNDLITGYSSSFQGGGIQLVRSRITTDEGNDKIDINGEWVADAGISLSSYSKIEMGAGDDVIESEFDVVLALSSLFDMGEGSDRVSIPEYSFIDNSGQILMGKDDDTFEGFGFGRGTFDGGSGTDLLRLPDGAYTVSRAGEIVTIANEYSQAMRVSGFELIGSLSDSFAQPIGIASIGSGFRIGESAEISLF